MLYSFLYGWNSIVTDLSAVLCVRDSTSSDYLSVCSSDRSAILLALLSYLFPLFYQYFNVDQFFFLTYKNGSEAGLSDRCVRVEFQDHFILLGDQLEVGRKFCSAQLNLDLEVIYVIFNLTISQLSNPDLYSEPSPWLAYIFFIIFLYPIYS